MLSFTEYYTRVCHLVTNCYLDPYVTLPLSHTLGSTLASSICAPIDLPPFANSSMDGYALHSSDTLHCSREHPRTLSISDYIIAGNQAQNSLLPGHAARIFTGAAIPPGADCVMKQEDCYRQNEHEVVISSPVPVGNFIRPQGDDCARGEEIFTIGTCLTPRHIGVLAALGITHCQVYRPLTLVIITTGNEIITPGTPLQAHQFYDSITPMLIAACQEINATIVKHYHCPDSPADLLKILHHIPECDIVLCIGGISVGDKDIVKQTLSPQVDFVRVAMQPGMPQGAGIYSLTTPGGIKDQTIICFPGNPVSAYISFEMFLRPAILAAQHRPVTRPTISAMLSEPADSPSHKLQIRRGYYEFPNQYPSTSPSFDHPYGYVRFTGSMHSHFHYHLALANCLVIIPEDITYLPTGSIVQIVLLGTEGG